MFLQDYALCDWRNVSLCTLIIGRITVGYSNFLEHTLIMIVRIDVGHIDFQPTLNFH